MANSVVYDVKNPISRWKSSLVRSYCIIYDIRSSFSIPPRATRFNKTNSGYLLGFLNYIIKHYFLIFSREVVMYVFSTSYRTSIRNNIISIILYLGNRIIRKSVNRCRRSKISIKTKKCTRLLLRMKYKFEFKSECNYLWKIYNIF